jgi:hypothetical protein
MNDRGVLFLQFVEEMQPILVFFFSHSAQILTYSQKIMPIQLFREYRRDTSAMCHITDLIRTFLFIHIRFMCRDNIHRRKDRDL